MKVVSKMNDCMIKRFERFYECVFFISNFYYIVINKKVKLCYTL